MERARNVIARRTYIKKRTLPARLIFCIALSAILLIIKLLFPGIISKIGAAVLPQIEKDIDYAAAVEAIGWAISGKNNETPKSEETALPKTSVQPTALPDKGSSDEALSNIAAKAVNVGIHSQINKAEETPACVSAFLEAQAEYVSLGFPEDVDYNLYQLPFETALPAEGTVTSAFGYRVHPASQTVKFHYGTDIGIAANSEICAFAAGEVICAAESSSYGKYIVISHAEGYETLYAHCSSLAVSSGQHVYAGDVIAAAGDTGNATGVCLHFEISRSGAYLNPEYYI